VHNIGLGGVEGVGFLTCATHIRSLGLANSARPWSCSAWCWGEKSKWLKLLRFLLHSTGGTGGCRHCSSALSRQSLVLSSTSKQQVMTNHPMIVQSCASFFTHIIFSCSWQKYVTNPVQVSAMKDLWQDIIDDYAPYYLAGVTTNMSEASHSYVHRGCLQNAFNALNAKTALNAF
jgi:hypothetical protein